MAKRRSKVDEARIQQAINGLLIPMLLIPQLHARLKAKIAEGADDACLAKVAHEFIYGKE